MLSNISVNFSLDWKILYNGRPPTLGPTPKTHKVQITEFCLGECDIGTHDCHDNATCSFVTADGSYSCACDTGYSGDGISCLGTLLLL